MEFIQLRLHGLSTLSFPVSYTHLDVYKRQALGRTMLYLVPAVLLLGSAAVVCLFHRYSWELHFNGSTLESRERKLQGTRTYHVVFSPSCVTPRLCCGGLFISPVLVGTTC